MGGWDLWPPDEPRFGQIAKEMIQSGNYIVPHVNNEPYSDKPPLNIWETVLISKLFYNGKVTEVATRLPSAVAGLGGLIAAFFIANLLFENRRIAFLSALILGTSYQYFEQARSGQLDMTLSFYCYVSILVFLLVYKGKTNNIFVVYLFWISAALGTLSKGPMGLIIPLGTIILFLLSNIEIKKIKIIRPYTGFLIFAIITLSWVIPAILSSTQSYSFDLLWKQTFKRYTAPTSHIQSRYFFFESLLGDFAPWILFLPLALWIGYKTKGTDVYPSFKFNLCWFIFTLVFFSLSKGKRSQYILPMYPAIAMTVGFYWETLFEHFKKMPKEIIIPILLITLSISGALIFGILAYSGILAPVGITIQTLEEFFTIDPERASHFPIITILFLTIISLIILSFSLIKRKTMCGFTSVLLVAILIYGSLIIKIYPAMNEFKTSRTLCDFINTNKKPGEVVGIYDFFRESYLFYGDYFLKRLETSEEVNNFFNTDKRVFCIVILGELKELKEYLRDKPIYTLYYEKVGSRKILVVSNKEK